MKIFIFILLILLPFVANSKEYVYKYFEQAEEYYNLKNYDKAIEVYKYIIDNFPKNERRIEALQNIIDIYQEQNKFEKIIELYKQMLDQNVSKKLIITVLYPIAEFYNEKNDFDKAIPFYKSIIGLKNIGTNSFQTNIPVKDNDYIKHNAARSLSTIYENKEMYDSAIYYLDISENVYQYWPSCGNEIVDKHYSTRIRYKNLYVKLNQPNKAIHKILSWYILCDNMKYDNLGELSDLLKDKKGLRTQFDSSINNMYTKKIQRNSKSYLQFYIKFLDYEYLVGQIEYTNDIKSKYKFYEEKLKHLDFYKIIEQME